MASLLENLLEIGLGALTLTKEKAEELVDRLVKMKEVPQEKGHEFLEKLVDKGRETREELAKIVQREVNEALDKANIARSEEVEQLQERIATLEARLASLEQAQPGAQA